MVMIVYNQVNPRYESITPLIGLQWINKINIYCIEWMTSNHSKTLNELNNKEWSQSQSHFFKYGCLMALTKYVALCRCWMWYVEVEQEHQNGVIVLQSLTNAASVQYENLSLYVHIDIYFTVLPAICDENVWTFTRITRIYLISYFRWFSQVRLTHMRNPLSNHGDNETWCTINSKALNTCSLDWRILILFFEITLHMNLCCKRNTCVFYSLVWQRVRCVF